VFRPLLVASAQSLAADGRAENTHKCPRGAAAVGRLLQAIRHVAPQFVQPRIAVIGRALALKVNELLPVEAALYILELAERFELELQDHLPPNEAQKSLRILIDWNVTRKSSPMTIARALSAKLPERRVTGP
jgi:hypothetical protein